ncbi:MAG TPA: DUF2291 domain-containing protein [Paludibaculum sp.]|jgi:predicted lipoprotein
MNILRHRVLAVCAACSGLIGCVPWTVRPIEDGTVNAAKGITTPSAYVDQIWTSKLLPAIAGSAVDAPALIHSMEKGLSAAQAQYARPNTNAASYWMVKGEGRVVAVDQRSRNGLIMVDVAPFDGRPDVSIQIGPVLRGTSLRDATGLVPFTDFLNQLHFADVGNELNERVLKLVLAPLDVKALKGRQVAFLGTAAADEGVPPIHALVPVRLELQP